MSLVVRAIDVGYYVDEVRRRREPRRGDQVSGFRMGDAQGNRPRPCARWRDSAPNGSDCDRRCRLRGRPGGAAGRDELFSRPPHDNRYIHTPEYLALVRGALRLMHVDNIDLLVVGLPVALFGSQRESAGSTAPRRARARHSCAARGASSESARPAGRGALLRDDRARRATAHAAGEGPSCGRRLADAGLGSHERRAHSSIGAPTRSRRASSTSSMRSRVRSGGARPTARSRRLCADRRGTPPERAGARRRNSQPLEPYLPLGERVADEAVTALRRLVQEGTDIDHIVLAGGGAPFFARAVARAYPSHPLTAVPDAFHANCRGFQIAGLHQAMHEARRPHGWRCGDAVTLERSDSSRISCAEPWPGAARQSDRAALRRVSRASW